MKKYIIQYEIETLLSIPEYEDFLYIEGFIIKKTKKIKNLNRRVIEKELSAKDYKNAFKLFMQKLDIIIPRLSLIGQCYIDYLNGSFLIKRNNIGFIRFIFKRAGVGLHFQENDKKILSYLVENYTSENRNNFYLYRYHFNNSYNILEKLYFINSAVEALAKAMGRKDKKGFKEDVFGKEIANILFGHNIGTRHRLIHGDFFLENNSYKDVETLYSKVINYLNINHILIEQKIETEIVNPQRNIIGNYTHLNSFIEIKDEDINLSEILLNITPDNIHNKKYFSYIEEIKDF